MIERSLGHVRPCEMVEPSRTHNSYPVGIVCALAIEKAAMEAMLDETHPRLGNRTGDKNDYTLGRLGAHNVAIACLPAGLTGNSSAAIVAKDMLRSFPIKIGLMVGVGGGVWSKKRDVRLGDVVVSQPEGTHSGVVQWDFGKMEKRGRFRRTGSLDKPPKVLLNAVQTIKTRHIQDGDNLERLLDTLTKNKPRMAEIFKYQGVEQDQLFKATYDHQGDDTCDICDASEVIRRPPRPNSAPSIHYGNIASGNEVIKDGVCRDELAAKEGVICFEMEAAGLMDDFPCLVIRGICDYADSHKNKNWQPYAAATAAAFAKELLGVVDEQGLNDLAPASRTSYSIPFSLKGIPNADYFIPRNNEMRQLESYFFPEVVKDVRQTVFVVYGLGGIGKTQLCVEFARKYHPRFSAVFWLDGSSKDTLNRSLAESAARLPYGRTGGTPHDCMRERDIDTSRMVRRFTSWLCQPSNRDWLLIFDNVDRESPDGTTDLQAYNLKDYLPVADHGSVLITTRLANLQRPRASLHLDKVDEEQARKILESYAGQRVQGAGPLLEKVGGLPLALVQAGAYLGQTGMPVYEYLEHYEKTWVRLMEYQNQYPLQEYAERSVLTTWKMSYEQVEKKSREAANLLKLWAFLAPSDLWYELVASVQELTVAIKVPDWLLHVIRDKLAFRHALGLLLQYSLVTSKAETSGYAMHPVLHMWSFHSIDSDDERIILYSLALAAVAESVPSDTDINFSDFGRRLVPHAVQLCLLTSWSVVDDGRQAGEMNRVAWLLNCWRNWKEAEAMYRRALQGSEKAWGPDHTSTLAAVSNLGLLHADQGKTAEAEEMYQRALQGFEKAWGLDHTSTLAIFNNLGNLYADQGKSVEAESMYQHALKGKERVCGLDHASTLKTVNNLGTLYANQGKSVQAEEMYQRALTGCQKAWGPDHALTLKIVNNLGNLYARQGKLAEAEEMYQRALKGKEKACGFSHTSTIRTVQNLGRLYADYSYGHYIQANTNGPVSSRLGGSTSSETANHCLTRTLRLFKSYPHARVSLLGKIGRMLLWSGDSANAVIAFEQQITYSDSSPTHGDTVCGGCGCTFKLGIKRFVCQTCRDLDLCKACLAKCGVGDSSIARLADCKNHDFLAVPMAELSTLAQRTGPVDVGDTPGWLEKVLLRVRPHKDHNEELVFRTKDDDGSTMQ